MISPFSLPPIESLTFDQLDGWNCVYCGDRAGVMKPVGHIHSVQVFAHPECAEPHRTETEQPSP